MFVLHPSHFLPPQGQRARQLAFTLLILVPFAVGALALYLGQDANWDLRNYHFYNAYAFLNQRYDRDLLPSQTPYFYNPLLDVPFFLLATHASAKIAGFGLGWMQGLNVVLLFIIAHATLVVPNPRHKVVICFVLSVLGLLGGGGIAQIGTTFGDNLTSLGIFLSAALIVRHAEKLMLGDAGRIFALCLLFGVPAGMMVGLKLPAVIYAIGLCGGLLFVPASPVRRLLLAFAFGLGVLLGAALTLGYWAWFLQSHFGSPLFPYFNNIFHSPLAPLTSARDVEYAPHSLSDWLAMPFLFALHPYRVGEIAWRDWRIPILYILLPAALLLRLFFGRNRRSVDALAAAPAARFLLAGFAIAYAVWLAMFTIYRYAIPLEMIAPLLIVLAAGLLPLTIGTRALITAFILAAVALSIQPGNWHRRTAWLDHFVEADLPDLGDTSNLMILMAGIEPYAHLVPTFPAQISFVRIASNFSFPQENKGINRLIHERIGGHKKSGGRFMMLIPPWQYGDADRSLGYFGLHLVPQHCQNVTDRLFDNAVMSLCPVL